MRSTYFSDGGIVGLGAGGRRPWRARCHGLEAAMKARRVPPVEQTAAPRPARAMFVVCCATRGGGGGSVIAGCGPVSWAYTSLSAQFRFSQLQSAHEEQGVQARARRPVTCFAWGAKNALLCRLRRPPGASIGLSTDPAGSRRPTLPHSGCRTGAWAVYPPTSRRTGLAIPRLLVEGRLRKPWSSSPRRAHGSTLPGGCHYLST
jgi:hypothetical protein